MFEWKEGLANTKDYRYYEVIIFISGTCRL